MTMNEKGKQEKKNERTLIKKPHWIDQLEERIALKVPIHPNIISAAKLFIIGPIMVLSMKQVGILPVKPWVVLSLFLAFAIMDYLDGVVARYKGLETHFGRIFDRLTDCPILIVLSFLCLDLIPPVLLGIKIGLDLLLMVLYIRGMGSTENRIRTGISYTTLIALLFVSQNWMSNFITPEFVVYLLIINIAFSTTVALYNMKILQP